VVGLTYDELLREGAFSLLGNLFPDQAKARGLLEDAGVGIGAVPPMAPSSPAEYWRTVCREIADGRHPTTLEKLLDAAIGWYPASAELKALRGRGGTTSTLRVLCLLASPADTSRIRLEVEHRVLQEIARTSPRLEVTVLPATRTRDIVPGLLRAKPDVLHFAGHGTPEGELVFEDDRGFARPVSAQVLAEVLDVVPPLLCVVLNSCYTGAYADVLAGRAKAVTGSRVPLGDRCAIAFTEGFYTGLAGGEELDVAYRAGLAQMRLSRCDTGEMCFRSGAGRAV
jgi:hypothetical protein